MERWFIRGALVVLCVISGTASVDIPPKITLQSVKDIYYKVGETVKIACEASGNPKPQYRWQKSGVDFNAAGNSERVVQLQDRGTLIINEPEDKDESIYQCFAENNLGRAASVKFNLRMAKLEGFRSQEAVTHTPELGDYLKLPCQSPDSVPDPEIYWAIRQEDGYFEPLDWNSTMSMDYEDKLHIAHVTSGNHQDGKSYHCIAWNDKMRTFAAGPPHYINPRGSSDKMTRMRSAWPKSDFDELGLVGSNHKLKCIFSGNPTPVVKWKRADDRKFPTRANSAGSGGQELVIRDLQFEDAGIYVCSATSTDFSSPIEMSINLGVESVPTWVKKPQDVEIGENATAIFECAAVGAPAPQIFWFVNGRSLEDALQTEKRLDKRFKRLKTTTIVLERVTPHDTMVFQCNATNAHGYVWGEAYLNVLAEAPAILQNPEDQLKVAEGQPFEITCQVSGKPDPIITWSKNGRQITGGRYTIKPKGNLYVEVAVPADSGMYKCKASNNHGSAEATGSLIVRRKTVIEQKPRDLEIRRGVYAKFTCSGTTDPEETRNLRTYWIKDQQVVELGARMFQNIQDNSLTISGTEQRDTGTFTCVVTNGLDEDRASARLVVTDVPDPAIKVNINNTCMAKKVAELTWIPGSFNNAPIQYFTVEYQTNVDPDRWVFAQKVNQTRSKAFIKLAAGLEYTFRVLAVNKIGSSKPSNASTTDCRTNNDNPTQNPRNVRTIGNHPGSLYVEWTPVPPEHQGGLGFYYDVLIERVGDPELSRESMTISNWRNYSLEYSSGRIYEAYDITIKSVNHKGTSLEQARKVRGYSAEGQPDISPSDLQSVEVGSEYVVLQWTFSSREIGRVNTRIRGEFRGFKIQVWQTSSRRDTIRDWDMPAEMFVNHTGDTYTARVAPITPNTGLSANVAVLNNFFVSAPTEELHFRTLAGLPGPVSYMDAITIADNHINLIWDPPLDNRGDIIGYDIGYQIERGLHLDEIQERIPQIDDRYATTAMLAGLIPLTKYRIHIWARSPAGRGESYYIERTTGRPGMLETPRYKIKDVGTDYINVSWFRDAYKLTNSIVFVQYKKEDGAEWFSTSPDVSREWVKLSPLEAGTTYSIRVVASNGKDRRLSVEEDVTTDGFARAYDVAANLGWFLAMLFSLFLHVGLVIALCVLYRRGFRLRTQNFSGPKTYRSGGQTFTGTTDHRDEFPRTSSDMGPEPPGYTNDYYDDRNSYEDQEYRDVHGYPDEYREDDQKYPHDYEQTNSSRGYNSKDDDSMRKGEPDDYDYNYRDFDDKQGQGHDYRTDDYSRDRGDDYNDRYDPAWDSRDLGYGRDKRDQRPRNAYNDRYAGRSSIDDYSQDDTQYNDGRYEDVRYQGGIKGGNYGPSDHEHDSDYPSDDPRRPRQHSHRPPHHRHDDDYDDDERQHDGKWRSVVDEVNKRHSGEVISGRGGGASGRGGGDGGGGGSQSGGSTTV